MKQSYIHTPKRAVVELSKDFDFNKPSTIVCLSTQYVGLDGAKILPRLINKREPVVKPVDKCVELYNELWLKIREQKNTLTSWISKLCDKVADVETLIVHNELAIDKLGDVVEDMEERMNRMREDIINELRDELLREVREEMRA